MPEPEKKPDSEQKDKNQGEQTTEKSGPELIKDAMSIARDDQEGSEGEPSKKPEKEELQKEEGTKPGEIKPSELKPDESKPGGEKAVEEITAEYEQELTKERREKEGIYHELKTKRQQLKELRARQKPPVEPAKPAEQVKQPAISIDTIMNDTSGQLKNLGFSEKQIEELKERALDDPMAVVTAVSYVIANKIKDDTIKSFEDEQEEAPAKVNETERNLQTEIVSTETNLRVNAERGWIESRKLVQKQHPDLYKNNEKGELIPDTENPKFKIYSEEAVALVTEAPELEFSGNLPWLAMRRMELRLQKEEAFSKGKEEGQQSESERQNRIQSGFVATGGRQPGSVENPEELLSEEELKQADKDIRRGIFKSRRDYAEWKLKKVVM